MSDLQEVLIVIDDHRSIEVTPTSSGSVVLALEDPDAVAIVDVPQEKLGELIDTLTRWRL